MQVILDVLKGSWSIEHTPSLLSKSLFYYLQSAGHYISGPKYLTERSNYDTILIMYTISGEGFLEYRGQRYALKPGTICIIDCIDKQVYGSDPDCGETDWVFDWVHFNGSESRGYADYIINAAGPVIALDHNNPMPDLISRLHRMIRTNNENFDIRASLTIVEILTELMLSITGGRNGEGIPEIVQKAVGIIEDKYFMPLDLDTIAEELCISKFHLSRQFKLHTGYSPCEYLIKYRLSQSKCLLKGTDEPVYEIARKVGFENTSHFIKVFKEQENITPLRFRKYWR